MYEPRGIALIGSYLCCPRDHSQDRRAASGRPHANGDRCSRVRNGGDSGLGAAVARNGEEHERAEVTQAAVGKRLCVALGLLVQDSGGLGAAIKL
jgi:hypothetical protein